MKKKETNGGLETTQRKENKLQFALGFANVDEIDQFNILEATKISMKRAIQKLNIDNANYQNMGSRNSIKQLLIKSNGPTKYRQPQKSDLVW